MDSTQSGLYIDREKKLPSPFCKEGHSGHLDLLANLTQSIHLVHTAKNH